MKNITKTEIRQNLKILDTLYRASTDNKKALFYSKLAVLELCGWLEDTIKSIVRSCAKRNLKDPHHQDAIEKEVIKRNHGFDYEKNFQKMLIRVVGLQGIETVERSVGLIAIDNLKREMNSLKKSRNSLAHTYLRNITTRFDAPSVTAQRFDFVFQALKEFQDTMRNKRL